MEKQLELQKLKISEEYLNIIRSLLDGISDAKWAVGDFLVEVINEHESEGIKRTQILYAIAGETKATYSQLDDYERTARKWIPEKRDLSLPWSIHRNAEPVQDQELLKKAAEENWNATTFKAAKYPDINSPNRLMARLFNTLNFLKNHKDLPAEIQEKFNRVHESLIELENEIIDFLN